MRMSAAWAAAAALLLSSGVARAEKCPNMLILLDRSASMWGFKWTAAKDAIQAFTANRQGFMRFGLVAFPSDNGCGRGVSLVHTDYYSSGDILAALDKLQPDGLTPTGDAIAFAGEQSPDMDDLTRRKFIVLVTDGDPTCPNYYDAEGNLKLAVDALGALKARDVKTFVIGFGEGVDPAKLNRMAEAGGTARQNATCKDPNDPSKQIPCEYYDALDKASLDVALDAIARATIGEIGGGTTCSDSCYGDDGCPAGEKCVMDLKTYQGGKFTMNSGKCVADPCAAVTCGPAQFCRNGQCIDACTSPCPTGSYCNDGSCLPDKCIADPQSCQCGSGCARYLLCVEGQCVENDCLSIRCPASAPYCDRGSCYALPAQDFGANATAQSTGPTEPTPPVDEHIPLPDNGCGCATVSTPLFALLGLLLARRRRG